MIKWLYEHIDQISVDLSTYTTNTDFATIEMRINHSAMPTDQAGILGWECIQCDALLVRTRPTTTPSGGTTCDLKPMSVWDSGFGPLHKTCNVGHLNDTTGGTTQTLSVTYEESWKCYNDGAPYGNFRIIAPQIKLRFSHDRTSGVYEVDYMIGAWC